MKILIVSQYFWPEVFRINDLGKGLVNRGHDVTVLTGMPNYPQGRIYSGYSFLRPTTENYKGVKVTRTPLIPRGKNSRVKLSVNYVSFLLFASVIGPFKLRHDYDVVFVYAPSPITVALPGILMARLCRCPLLLWVQDLWPESLTAVGAVKSRLILTLVGRLVRWIYLHCSLILVQSEGFIENICNYGIDRKDVYYLPNPAENFYRPVQLDLGAKERNEVPDGFCVMFAGNIGISQSLDTTLDAAELTKSYRDIHWVIIGDGVDRGRINREIMRRGLASNVHMLGWKAVEAMPRYFSLADVLLVTLRSSPIFSLTVPAKMQSYMACGKPIVSCLDGEGARLIRRSRSGIAVPAENSQSLAEAVLFLHSKTPEYRSEIGKNGISYFEKHFSMDLVLNKLEQIIGVATKESK